MKRNKYLEEIGIPVEDIWLNSVMPYKKKQKKYWKKQRKIYGFDERETWNLDFLSIEWLYSHLRMYLDRSTAIFDLTKYTVPHNGKTYTQEEAIRYILKRFKKYLKTYHAFPILSRDTDEKIVQGVQDALVLYSKILPMMWW